MRFKQFILTVTAAVFLFNAASASLNVEVVKENPTPEINDASATLKVVGGVAPFQYKWSFQGVALTSNTATGITEGRPFTCVITDATGETFTIEEEISDESIVENMNSAFIPIVNAIATVFFWDPLDAVGLRDPNIFDEEGNAILHPNGDQRTQGVPIVVLWLVLGAIFFTIRMKFINFRGFKHAIELVQGKYDNPNDKGEVSHFQALTTALSATVGLGNIAGVAVAITLGGPGATFWMIFAGLIGMASKFVECTLGVKYRIFSKDGEVSGGPMYYLSQGLEKKGMKRLGKVLAMIFAILCIGASFGGGNMFQANQAFAQLSNQMPFLQGNGFWFGIVLAVMVGVVIIGGIKSIAKVTDKIVPIMCGVYVLFALIIIAMNITSVGTVLAQIFDGAFSPTALKGGFVGVLVVGFQRAAFSNEAGVGSASIAHSASKTDEPVSEGIVALLEPFVDTVLVCTMTALVLIFTGFHDGSSGLGGSELTSAAFSSVFPWFSWVLVVAIFLFAFSTMISWSYYGQKAWGYVFGNSKKASYVYKFIFLLFIVVGSSVGLGAVLDFSDFMILGMALPNVLGLVLLSKEVREDLASYFKRIKSGEIKRYK